MPLVSSQEASWTMTNITYICGHFLMFHWVRGVPFEFNSGAYDNLNMWEQIDNGDQYTPAKKFLLSVPIILFLVSTHYTHYDLTYFTINILATLTVVIPKLPAVRLSFFFSWLPPELTYLHSCIGRVWPSFLASRKTRSSWLCWAERASSCARVGFSGRLM